MHEIYIFGGIQVCACNFRMMHCKKYSDFVSAAHGRLGCAHDHMVPGSGPKRVRKEQRDTSAQHCRGDLLLHPQLLLAAGWLYRALSAQHLGGNGRPPCFYGLHNVPC